MLQTIKKNISVIPAVPAHTVEGSQQTKLLRVAAYCRVSTLQEQQESSYEAQVNHYREKIQNHPGWKLAYTPMMGKVPPVPKNVWIFRQ